jgi:DNA-binding MarR family transcriptional regulator
VVIAAFGVSWRRFSREEGHPHAKPLHGFALQAIGNEGTTAVELGRRLGVSKQAAGKTISTLERLGYVTRTSDPRDARRKLVTVTSSGSDMLRRSAEIFTDIRASWEKRLGGERLRSLEADLRGAAGDTGIRLDTPGWLGP